MTTVQETFLKRMKEARLDKAVPEHVLRDSIRQYAHAWYDGVKAIAGESVAKGYVDPIAYIFEPDWVPNDSWKWWLP